MGKDTVVDSGGCKDVNLFSVSNNYQETSGGSEITSPSVCASVPAPLDGSVSLSPKFAKDCFSCTPSGDSNEKLFVMCPF